MAYNNPKITHHAGAPLDIRFPRIIDGDAGGPLNLTGKTLAFAMAAASSPSSYEGDPVVEKTGPDENAIELLSAVTGSCVVHLLGADTAELAGLYHYQLTVIDGADASPVATGLIFFERNLHT